MRRFFCVALTVLIIALAVFGALALFGVFDEEAEAVQPRRESTRRSRISSSANR